MYHLLGEETFQKAIRFYIKDRHLNSTTSNDLYNIFSRVITEVSSEKDAMLFVNTTRCLVENPETPLITIVQDESQKHLFLTKHIIGDSKRDGDTNFQLPINIAFKSNLTFNDTKPTQWFLKEQGSLLIGYENVEWHIINKQQAYFYRVAYDYPNYMLLIQELNGPNYTIIPPETRAQLIDDGLELVFTSDIQITIQMGMLNYLQQEVDYIPWIAGFKSLKYFYETYCGNHLFHRLIFFGQAIMKKAYLAHRITYHYNPSNHIFNLFSGQISAMACRYELFECTNDAIHMFKNTNYDHIPPNIRYAVYCSGLRNSSNSLNIALNRLSELARTQDDYLKNHNEILDILSALGCVNDNNNLDGYVLYYIFSWSE